MTTGQIAEQLGRRRINLIWEVTQSAIAASVSGVTLYTSATIVLKGDNTEAAFVLMSNAFFLVVGFYFGRTDHARPSSGGRIDDNKPIE